MSKRKETGRQTPYFPLPVTNLCPFLPPSLSSCLTYSPPLSPCRPLFCHLINELPRAEKEKLQKSLPSSTLSSHSLSSKMRSGWLAGLLTLGTNLGGGAAATSTCCLRHARKSARAVGSSVPPLPLSPSLPSRPLAFPPRARLPVAVIDERRTRE